MRVCKNFFVCRLNHYQRNAEVSCMILRYLSVFDCDVVKIFAADDTRKSDNVRATWLHQRQLFVLRESLHYTEKHSKFWSIVRRSCNARSKLKSLSYTIMSMILWLATLLYVIWFVVNITPIIAKKLKYLCWINEL